MDSSQLSIPRESIAGAESSEESNAAPSEESTALGFFGSHISQPPLRSTFAVLTPSRLRARSSVPSEIPSALESTPDITRRLMTAVAELGFEEVRRLLQGRARLFRREGENRASVVLRLAEELQTRGLDAWRAVAGVENGRQADEPYSARTWTLLRSEARSENPDCCCHLLTLRLSPHRLNQAV